MALKNFTDEPRITDTILLKIETTDTSGCLIDPYKIDSVTVYYVERNFLGQNFGEYDYQIQDDDLRTQLDEAVAAACLDPTPDNLALVVNLQQRLSSSTTSIPYHYKESAPVVVS